MYTPRLILLSLSCLLSSTTFAVDLIESYQLAFENNASLKSSKFVSEAQKLELDVARTAGYPTLRIAGKFQDVDSAVTDSSIDGTYGEISLTQPVYDSRIRAGINTATNTASLADLQFQLTEVNLIVDVVNAYFDVLASQDDLRTVQSEVAAIEEFLEHANIRLEVGLGSDSDVKYATARFSLANAAQIGAQSALETARLKLSEVLGTMPGSLAVLQEDSDIIAYYARYSNEDVAKWVQTSLENNLQLKIQAKVIAVAEDKIELEKSELDPKVELSLTKSEHLGGDTVFNSDTTIFLSAVFKFQTGGMVSKRTEQARLSLEAELQNGNFLKQQVTNDITSTHLLINSLKNQIDAFEAAVSANETALLATQEGFNVGTQTSLEVLNSQRDLFQARRDLQRARYDYLFSIVRLEAIAGTLDLDDIKFINQFLKS